MKKTFDTEKKLYTLSLLVQDIPGVLSQVARLFSRKGYNIESIVSGETSQPGLTRITIVILGDELMVNQIAAQCRKLIPVQVVKISGRGDLHPAGVRHDQGHGGGPHTPGTRSSRWPTSSGPTSST